KAILRSLLVTAFESEEVRLRNELLTTAVSDISRELEPLLQSQEMQNLKEELRGFFIFAADVWKPVQRSQRWVLATSDLGSCLQHSWRYSERCTTSEFPLSSGSPSLVLFPHIFDENEEEPLYPGLVWCGNSNLKGTAENTSGIPPRLQVTEENETSTGTGPGEAIWNAQAKGPSAATAKELLGKRTSVVPMAVEVAGVWRQQASPQEDFNYGCALRTVRKRYGNISAYLCFPVCGDPQKCLQRMREDLQQRNKKATLACNRQFDLSNEGNFLDLFYSMAFASGLSEWELGIVNLLR
ncbi:hypothetical protein KXW37_001568, partial [Aspergillus fumigatus]